MVGRPIASVLVAGGGVEGWLVALSLVRRLPGVRVTVAEALPDPIGPADRYAAARPGIRKTLGKLGIAEGPLLAATGGVVRLGQRYDGWSGRGSSFLHCFGRYGARVGPAPFHQAWLRAAARGEAPPLGPHSAAVMLAEANRVAEPSTDEYSPLASFEFGFAFDPLLLRDHLRGLALAAGAEAVGSGLAAVRTSGPKRIEAVALQDGRLLAADLFVDCTGPAARLLSALHGGGDREDWSGWLRCDRLLVADGPALADPPLVDRAAALSAGWRLEAPLRSRTIHAFLYPADAVSDARAARLLRNASAAEAEEAPIALAQGRRTRFWIGNCVALGDAAALLEPLNAPGLHMLTAAIERLLAFLPDSDFAAVELGEYNRKLAVEIDLVRDFVILHHALAQRAEPASRITDDEPLPPDLAHTLALFRARGKVPGREGETASLDDWLAVLLNHGVTAAQADPLLDQVPAAEFASLSAAIRAVIAEAVATTPTHRQFLASIGG